MPGVVSEQFEEYRRMADYCADMSSLAHSVELRASWLSLAAQWLALLPKRETTESEKFKVMVGDLRTGQKDSTSSH